VLVTIVSDEYAITILIDASDGDGADDNNQWTIQIFFQAAVGPYFLGPNVLFSFPWSNKHM
jgi:hypothetical protein